MLSLEGRIIIFETLTISKIVYLVFLTAIPNSLIEGENGGLKNVDVSSKTISLQCSWLQKLCHENFHEWKIIPSHLINKYLHFISFMPLFRSQSTY